MVSHSYSLCFVWRISFLILRCYQAGAEILNIDEPRAQHSAAVKVVQAENKKKIDDKKRGNG
jgi:hypothetical protein